jgi:hypothetical protein
MLFNSIPFVVLILVTFCWQTMSERYAADKYHSLEFDRSRNHKTKDGVHLVRAEADRVAEVIDYISHLANQQVGSGRNRQASRQSP